MKPNFSYQRRIREIDLDFLGHVNHAKYLSILEEARWELLAESGYDFNRLRHEMISPVILGVNIQYKKEIVNREHITIETWTASPIGKVMLLRQVIRKENGQIGAEADITYGVMDLKQRKLVMPPDVWLAAIDWKPETNGGTNLPSEV